MLIKTEQHPEKNPVWGHWTPNECYNDPGLALTHLGFNYPKVVHAWMQKYQLQTKRKWFEVRILKSTSLVIPGQNARDWWKDAAFQEAVFWVYQTPEKAEFDGETGYVYVLEFMEALRVEKLLWERTGRKPFRAEYPMLWLPVDCAEHAWNERSAGFSDHLRHRPEESKSQEQVEKEEKQKEDIERIIKNDIVPLAEGELEELAECTPLEREVA